MEKIKLDLVDRKILSELDKDSRIPVTILSKKVGKSREAVKYRIAQLEKKGVIRGFLTAINPAKLGFFMFKVYLKLENIPNEREKFFEQLMKRNDIYWLGECDGAFDAVFIILSRSLLDYYEKINSLVANWKHLIISKTLGAMVDTRQYNKKFLLNGTEGEFVVFGGEVINNHVDELDLHILNTLATNARISLVELSKKTNSTIEIVRTRIRKLEEKKIILSYRVDIDFNKLGLEFFKAIIYFRNMTKKDEESIQEWMRVHPNSVYLIRSLAPWDAEFEFVVENYQEFNQIINKLRNDFSDVIRNYEHLIMIREAWTPASTIAMSV